MTCIHGRFANGIRAFSIYLSGDRILILSQISSGHLAIKICFLLDADAIREGLIEISKVVDFKLP